MHGEFSRSSVKQEECSCVLLLKSVTFFYSCTNAHVLQLVFFVDQPVKQERCLITGYFCKPNIAYHVLSCPESTSDSVIPSLKLKREFWEPG